MRGFQLQRLGPLMEPQSGNPLAIEGVLNPAAVRGRDGQLYLLLVISVAVSIASTTLGTWLSLALHRTPGSMVVLVAAGFFFLSLLPRFTTWSSH